MSRSYEKINTFSRVPSPAQIASYVIIAIQSIVFFALLQPNFESDILRITFTVLFSCSVAAIFITTFISSFIDPSDSIMIECIKGNQSKISSKLDQLLYCDYCRSYVAENSRHCRQCDRCVQNFDHHCMWINNCVGSKNYKAFIAMILSVFFNLLIYVVAAILLTVQDSWSEIIGMMIPTWIIMAIVSIFCILVLNLILLHIYLGCKGYTTYQFIIARRQQERLQQLRRIDEKKLLKEEQNKKVMEEFKKKRQQKKQQMDKQLKNQGNSELMKVVEIESEESVSKIQFKEGKTSNIGSEKSNQISNVTNSEKPKRYMHESDHIVFCEKQFTQKSLEESEEKKEKKNQQEEKMQTSSDQSIRISQFFMRNKSFNLFINSDAPVKPHRKILNASAIVSYDKTNDNHNLKKKKSKTKTIRKK